MTADRYEIRPYRPGDEDSILAGFNRVFREVCGPGYVDRSMAGWRWEFADNPAGSRITVGLAEGTVAAHYAGVPQRVSTAYGPMTFVHIVDSFVVPEHRAGLRRPGLFVETALPWFELCDAMGDAVLYGYPVKTAERIGQRYLGYEFLRVIEYLCRDVGIGAVAAPASVAVERVTSIPADIDALFDRVAAERRCLVTRDRRYLDWRYVAMPGADASYAIHSARRDGELAGLLVLRPEHELVPSACTIADWIVPAADVEVADALLAKATEVARAAGRDTLMAVFAPTSPEHELLCARAFESRSSGEWFERRLTHRIYDPRLTSEWLAEHWWYTLGDTDLV